MLYINAFLIISYYDIFSYLGPKTEHSAQNTVIQHLELPIRQEAGGQKAVRQHRERCGSPAAAGGARSDRHGLNGRGIREVDRPRVELGFRRGRAAVQRVVNRSGGHGIRDGDGHRIIEDAAARCDDRRRGEIGESENRK